MEPSKESTKKRGAERRDVARPSLLLKRIDEAARAITAAPLAEREAAVLRRETAPRTILALARFNRTEPELLQTIATSRRWVGFYDIVQTLCFNPRTPTRAALPLLQRLYPLDLTKLLGQVRLPPPLRTAAGHLLKTRVEGLSPGERLGLARNARGPALALLLSIETAARVREALLASPGLREMDVLQFITGNKATSEALGQVGKDRRWSKRARVRAILAQQPKTPPDVALTLIESLPLQELKPIVRDDRISPWYDLSPDVGSKKNRDKGLSPQLPNPRSRPPMSEMDFGEQILAELQRDEVSPEMKMALAQQLLPLDQNDLLKILFILCGDSDGPTAIAAQRSLHELPESAFVNMAEAPQTAPALLHSLARTKMDSFEVLRRLVLNKSAEDQTIEMISRNCSYEEILSLVAGNQERLLRHSVLFEILIHNPAMSAFRRQQLEIYKEELISRGQFAMNQPVVEEPEEEVVKTAVVGEATQAEAEVDAPEPEAEPAPARAGFNLDLIADFELGEGGPFSQSEMMPFDVYAAADALTDDQKETNIYRLVSSMKKRDKEKLAQFGGPGVRNLLIRDGDTKVALNVLKNPKVGDGDLERFVRMRNINGEVLREIGANRAWLRNYQVVLGLVENPRTPVAISLNLMNLLRENNIKQLTKSREVPQAVRNAAANRIAAKARKASGH